MKNSFIESGKWSGTCPPLFLFSRINLSSFFVNLFDTIVSEHVSQDVADSSAPFGLLVGGSHALPDHWPN